VLKSATIENLARSQVAPGFPVAGIGMSSGGLPPLIMHLDKLSPSTGMAFVVIHHLRHSPNFMAAILSRYTIMPVELASAEWPLEPNHVYILPSGKEITISDGGLRLRPLSKTMGWSNVVTIFLQSLAESGHPGIAVILSGMDSDGAAALKIFHAHGGIVLLRI
jgi:two-component system CheB/CheR fusion protein